MVTSQGILQENKKQRDNHSHIR